MKENVRLDPENHPNDPIIVKNLTKTYENNKEVLKSISFGIKPKEIFGLLGPNGAGFFMFFAATNMN